MWHKHQYRLQLLMLQRWTMCMAPQNDSVRSANFFTACRHKNLTPSSSGVAPLNNLQTTDNPVWIHSKCTGSMAMDAREGKEGTDIHDNTVYNSTAVPVVI